MIDEKEEMEIQGGYVSHPVFHLTTELPCSRCKEAAYHGAVVGTGMVNRKTGAAQAETRNESETPAAQGDGEPA